jgi:hypothetical protein
LEKIEEIFSKPWKERTNVAYYLRCACIPELLLRKKGKKEKTMQLQATRKLSTASTKGLLV